MSAVSLREFRAYVGTRSDVCDRVVSLLTQNGDLPGVAEVAQQHGFEVSEDDLEDFLIDPGDDLMDWEEELALGAASGGQKGELRRRRYELRRRSIPSAAATCDYSSDVRLKRDIEPAGSSPSGIPCYTFSYRDETKPGRYFGTMAQDLLDGHPEAVVTRPDGFYAVRYDLIDVDFYLLDEAAAE